jgi:hypothetical protein
LREESTMAERQPWLYIGSEDVTRTRLRQHIREAEYWTDRAREEDGPDGRREEINQGKKLAFMVALGEVLRTQRWRPEGQATDRVRIPYFGDMVNPDGEAAHDLWIANEYLRYVENHGRDAVIKGTDPFDPAAAFEPEKTWH